MNFLTLSVIFLPHCDALKTNLKLSSSKMISDESLAAWHPFPIQKPTFAILRAWTSAKPSAVIATEAPSYFNPTISVNLSIGEDLANTLSL